MPDILPSFEQKDRAGTTTLIKGTATSTPTSYPAVAGDGISEFYIQNMSGLNDLEISWDAGANYKTIKANCWLGWSLKGNITQLLIRRSGANDALFELILNRDGN